VGRCGGSAEGRGEVITSYVEEAAVLSREIWKLIVREGAAVAVRLLAVALFLGTWGAGLPIGFWSFLLGLLASAAGFFSVLDLGFFSSLAWLRRRKPPPSWTTEVMSAAESLNQQTPPWRALPGSVRRAAVEGNRDLRGRSGRFSDEGGKWKSGGTASGAFRQLGRHSG
jgi:hypothetical protein